MSKTPSISEFYNNRSVFVTGATGFLGKILIEKLLRSCPGISNVYILLRSKKDKDVNSRLKELLQSKAFDKIKSNSPQALSKLKALNGDITKPDFGLDPNDIQLLIKNVTVVFHSAASLRFVEPLKTAIANNLLPVDYLLKLCKRMTSLIALVHVSTAYSNCTRSTLDEIIYPPIIPPKTIINLFNNLDTDILEKLTPTLLGEYPNTYVYTKGLAEALISEERGDLPTAVVRPSIVGTSAREPFEGWIDNFNHSSTYIIMAGTGLSRNIMYVPNSIVDFVPADVCVNLIITVARERAMDNTKEIKVYNSVSSSLNPLTSDVYLQYALNQFYKHPFCNMTRVPINLTNHSNLTTYSIYMMWDYVTFIYPFDTLLRLLGKNSKLKHYFNKYWNVSMVIEKFAMKQWIFKSDNVLNLWSTLTTEEKETFNFDICQIKWPEYLENSCLGCKRYLLNEDQSTIPQAKKTYNRLYLIHYTVKYAKWLIGLSLLALWQLQ